MTDRPCKYCGAYSKRSCDWEDTCGSPDETPPCEIDDDAFGPDPDRLREDRDERKRREKEGEKS